MTFRIFGAVAMLIANLGGVAQAASATWSGSVNSAWTNVDNWGGPPASVPGAAETATFDNAGNGNTTIDLSGGVTIHTIQFNTSSAAAFTIGTGGANGQALTWNSGGAFSMDDAVPSTQLIDATVNLSGGGAYSVSNASLSMLTIAGNVVPPGSGADGVLKKTGAGLVVISGNPNWWCSNEDSRNGTFYVGGGGELRLTGGKNNFAQTANSGRGARWRCHVGYDGSGFSGTNTLRLQDGGKVSIGALSIGAGSYFADNRYGNNALILATPGTSANPTVGFVGAAQSDIYDFGAQVLGENTDGNSIQISNGAYMQVQPGKSFYIGANYYDAGGGNTNYIIIDGANSKLERNSNNMTMVGYKGNGNYVRITNGGNFIAIRLNVGAYGNNNYVRVTGTGAAASAQLNFAGQTIIGVGGAKASNATSLSPAYNPSGNYILIEAGGLFQADSNQNRDNYIGCYTGADNNYIQADGTNTVFKNRQAQPLYIGGSSAGDSLAASNYLAVTDGAEAYANSVYVMGVASKVKIGSGTSNIAQMEVRQTSGFVGGIFMTNADARVEMNSGRLVAGQNATPAEMVSGPGKVQLDGPAYFSTAFSGSIISSVITGSGNLTKEGSGTLTLTAVNTYTGNTIVSNGTLAINQPYLSDAADVYLVSGSTLTLNFSGVDVIGGLYLDNEPQPQGIYGAGALGGAISGSMGGRLRVGKGPGQSGFNLIVK